MSENSVGKKISKFECDIVNRHPVISWLIIGIVCTIVGVLFDRIVPPRPQGYSTTTGTRTSRVTVENLGLWHASKDYNVVSSDVIERYDVVEGKDYVTIKQTSDKTLDLTIKGLPKSQPIKVDIIGSDVVGVEEKR